MTLEIKKVKTVLNNVEDRKGLSPKCHGVGHLPFILSTKCCLLSDVQYHPQPPKVGESVCYQGVFSKPQICGWSSVAGRGLHSAVLLAPPGWELTLAAAWMEDFGQEQHWSTAQEGLHCWSLQDLQFQRDSAPHGRPLRLESHCGGQKLSAAVISWPDNETMALKIIKMRLKRCIPSRVLAY